MLESYKKFLIRFLIMVLVVAGGYFIWDRYLSSAGRERRFAEEQMRNYEAKEKAYIAAMTVDTYGGKTPQETLDLFVAALEKGDVELASKFFLLDENLSRDKWIDYLKGVKDKNLLLIMATDFQTATFYKSLNDKSQQFVIYNKDRSDSLIIDMRLNKYTQVWKIERL